MDSKIYNLALSLVRNIGNIKFFNIIEKFKTAENFLSLNYKDIAGYQKIITEQVWNSRDKLLKKAEDYVLFAKNNGWGLVFFDEEEYPSQLLNIYQPPIFLFYVGDLELIKTRRLISVVGTRKITSYGQKIIKRIFNEMSDDNIAIVSGLAYGVDACAHRTAIEESMKTIGVIGTSLDIKYPNLNRDLYDEMEKKHLILSEFLPSTGPEKANFPKRNRIISGLSNVLIVVESALKGGSLITARLALEQGKEVFAVPGDIFSEQSKGTNFLINQGANLLLNGYDDILEVMHWRKKNKNIKNIVIENPIDKCILNILDQYNVLHVDELIRKLEYSQNEIMVRLTMLELNSYIIKQAGNFYARII